MIYCPIAICFPCFCNHIVTGIVTLTARLLSHSQPCESEYLPIALHPFYIICIKLFKRTYRQRIFTWAMSNFSIHVLARFQLYAPTSL